MKKLKQCKNSQIHHLSLKGIPGYQSNNTQSLVTGFVISVNFVRRCKSPQLDFFPTTYLITPLHRHVHSHLNCVLYWDLFRGIIDSTSFVLIKGNGSLKRLILAKQCALQLVGKLDEPHLYLQTTMQENNCKIKQSSSRSAVSNL